MHTLEGRVTAQHRQLLVVIACGVILCCIEKVQTKLLCDYTAQLLAELVLGLS